MWSTTLQLIAVVWHLVGNVKKCFHSVSQVATLLIMQKSKIFTLQHDLCHRTPQDRYELIKEQPKGAYYLS